LANDLNFDKNCGTDIIGCLFNGLEVSAANLKRHFIFRSSKILPSMSY